MRNITFTVIKKFIVVEVLRNISSRYKVVLSDESVEELVSILERKEFQKDEIILEQGKISCYMYIIEKGIIRQYHYKDGRNISEHFSCEGEIATCLENLFLKEPTRLNIEAIEQSVVYLLDYKRFKILSNSHPDINELLQTIL